MKSAKYLVTCLDPSSREVQTVEVDAISDREAAIKLAAPGRLILSARKEGDVVERPPEVGILMSKGERMKLRSTIASGVFSGLFWFTILVVVIWGLASLGALVLSVPSSQQSQFQSSNDAAREMSADHLKFMKSLQR